MHHPAWASPIGARKRDKAHGALQRIADSLNMPVEVLRQNGKSERYPDPAAELVRLWFKIQTEEGRNTVLRIIREIADEAELKQS